VTQQCGRRTTEGGRDDLVDGLFQLTPAVGGVSAGTPLANRASTGRRVLFL
jgi:hypothetical protein